jgi:hypothetical protein
VQDGLDDRRELLLRDEAVQLITNQLLSQLKTADTKTRKTMT